jgi:hypothetical protein
MTRIAPEDVIHFRFGVDPDNIRLGLSPLASVLREVFTDDEGANFTSTLLRNMGVPGLLVAPSSDDAQPSDEDVKATKSYLSAMFTGDRRGEPLVMSAPTKIEQFGFSPEQLNLRELRRIPEERVSACLGVPAIVAGLGAGLDRSTYCLPADARVWTSTGPEAIADVRAGRTVWSLVEGRLEPRRVTYAGCTGTKPLLELRTKNRTVRATGNHPFLVRVPGSMTVGANHERHPSLEWRRADQIRVGDHVVQPKALPDQGVQTLPDGEPASRELLQFMGAIIGDGTVSAVGIRMAMPPSDRCVGAYQRLALALFTKQEHQTGGNRVAQAAVARVPVVLQERERDFGFSSALEAERLTLLGLGGRAHTKRVPSWVWTLTRELRLAFLAGLVDTDGSIDKRGALTFSFCNRELTHDVRDLLVSVGIQASNVCSKTIGADCLPNPGRREQYEAWLFTASSARQVAEIPFADPLYRERVEQNATRYKSDGVDAHKAGLAEHLGFYEVKAVRELPAEPIYDLTVEGGHSFVADGVVVHNTNFVEARAAAYESNIIPAQRVFAEELDHQLLPEFEPQAQDFVTGFDRSEVSVLQEDRGNKVARLNTQVAGGWMKVSEARREVGLEVDASHEVYLRPLNLLEVPADGQPRPAQPDAETRALQRLASVWQRDGALVGELVGGNGNGKASDYPAGLESPQNFSQGPPAVFFTDGAIQVRVEAPPAPAVNVAAPRVIVDEGAIQVNVSAQGGRTTKHVLRDDQGRIEAIEEVPA